MVNTRRKVYPVIGSGRGVEGRRIYKVVAKGGEICKKCKSVKKAAAVGGSSSESEEVVFGFYGHDTDPRSKGADEYRESVIRIGRYAVGSEQRWRKEELARKNIDEEEDSASKLRAAEIRKAFFSNSDVPNPEEVILEFFKKNLPPPMPGPDATDEDLLTDRNKERIKLIEENWEKEARSMDLEYSQMALKFYKDRHKTNYKLTRTLGCNGNARWLHGNFEAELAPPCQCAASTKLFFAEVLHFNSSVVKTLSHSG